MIVPTREISLNIQDLSEATSLAALVRALNVTGHNPATSGNYSLRSQTLPGVALVSESGIDKSQFNEKNLLLVDIQSGQLHLPEDAGRKSSDETAIHLGIYQATAANCVLHSHILESLLFADIHPGQESVCLTGLELLKGFKGIKTHEAKVRVPLFENTQDIDTLAIDIKRALYEEETPVYGVILRGHGLYVWGASVKEAKRHLEVFEYIFKYHIALKRLT